MLSLTVTVTSTSPPKPFAVPVYVPGVNEGPADAPEPPACDKALDAADFTAVLVIVAPETASISADCFSRMLSFKVGMAAPPTSGVSFAPVISTLEIPPLSPIVKVTSTSPPNPFATPVYVPGV